MHMIIGNDFHVDDTDWSLLEDYLEGGYRIIHYFEDKRQCSDYQGMIEKLLSPEKRKRMKIAVAESSDKEIPFESEWPTKYKVIALLEVSNNEEATIFLKTDLEFIG